MDPAATMTELLGLKHEPVAIKFGDRAPAGVPRLKTRAASSCTYWKLAAQGHTFYTEASDHYGCPIGCYTHGVELPADTAKELEGVVTMMVQLEYLDPKEVAEIPRRSEPFSTAVYAPLGSATFKPDVVIVAGTARQIMLLSEAIRAAGLPGESSMMGRPTCAAIPAAVQSNGGATSLGCIGNRVYTDLGDDELYCAIAGSRLPDVTIKLRTILSANRALEKFHRDRLPLRA